MGQPIKAILFDKDGTLFDFEATWARVVEDVLDLLTPDPELRLALAGQGGYNPATRRFRPGAALVAATTSEIAELWAPSLPDRSVAEIEDIANRMGEAASQDGALVPACPDLPGLLGDLRQWGYRLGVATHDAERSTKAQLQSVGALGLFDFIAGYDSGHGFKPGPGMLLAFAAASGVAPAQVAMVGDSTGDLAMVGNAGGGLAIGVLTGPAEEADLAPYSDHVLASIADLPNLLGHAS
ncbi:MAG: HAD family hydrolase [Pseudomonadota bacterium]